MNALSAKLSEWEAMQPKSEPPVVLKLFTPSRKEIVAGGEVLWKPVNRDAAKLLSRASWLSKPPETYHEKPTPIPQKMPANKGAKESAPHTNQYPLRRKVEIKSRKEGPPAYPVSKEVNNERPRDRMNNSPPAASPLIGDRTSRQYKKNDSEFNDEICEAFTKRTEGAVDKTEDLLTRTLEARAAIDHLAEEWKASWVDFQSTCNTRLTELRMTRMSTESEMRQLLSSLKEVRAFFLDQDYESQVARLKDFVETCERLKALKDSGFLDQVADTMLRLA